MRKVEKEESKLNKQIILYSIAIVIVIGLIITILILVKTNNNQVVVKNKKDYFTLSVSYLESELGNNSDYNTKNRYHVFSEYNPYGMTKNKKEEIYYVYLGVVLREFYKSPDIEAGVTISNNYKCTIDNRKGNEEIVECISPDNNNTKELKKLFPKTMYEKAKEFNLNSLNQAFFTKVNEYYGGIK